LVEVIGMNCTLSNFTRERRTWQCCSVSSYTYAWIFLTR